MRINDEDRQHVIAELRGEQRALRRHQRKCMDPRSPDYEGQDEDDEEEPRPRAFAERHRAGQLARRMGKEEIAALVAESLRVMLAAYDAEDAVPQARLDEVRIHLAAWDLAKGRS